MELNAAQRLYARCLTWGTRIGLFVLAASFIAYLAGLPPHVPIERLPEVWKLSSAELLAATGARGGWSWAAFLPASDMLVLAAIAVLSACSIPCLLASAGAFGRSRERVLVAICLLEVAVLLLAASALLTVGH